MKIVLLLLCMALAGCGAKSSEDIAKDLIKEKLKTSLPDYNNYEPVNFGTMGTAFLPFEETGQYITNLKALNDYKDSITILEKMIKENKATSTDGDAYRKKLQQFLDSAKAINERNNTDKQAYIPGKLFKLSHAYKVKDKSGVEKQTEEEFYFDKDLKRVVKIHKVY
jgi:flagellar basal body L-ring protein FlgH